MLLVRQKMNFLFYLPSSINEAKELGTNGVDEQQEQEKNERKRYTYFVSLVYLLFKLESLYSSTSEKNTLANINLSNISKEEKRNYLLDLRVSMSIYLINEKVQQVLHVSSILCIHFTYKKFEEIVIFRDTMCDVMKVS